MIYATAAQGFEPGGWNGIADGSPPIYGPNGEKTLLGFDKEEAVQYEFGWKGEMADGRLSATAAFFYINYESRQFEFIAPNPSGDGTLIDGITNVGDSTQRGVELSFAWQASEYLRLTGAYGYINAEWDNGTTLADGGDLSGETPPNIIENSATLNANFRMPAMAGFDFVTDVQVSHNGEMQGGKPWDNVKNPDFTVVDLQMGFVSDQWEILLNVENLFDQEYYTDLEPFPNFSFGGLTGSEPGNIIIGTHGQPQLITGSVTYRF
jgi:iron complex outermembrane receptor protein